MSAEVQPTPEPAQWHPRDGLGDTVEERWRRLRERTAIRDPSRLRELVEAAFADPQLRVLSPGTSAYWLRFSHWATPPCFNGLPLVRALRNSGYEVRTAEGRLLEATDVAEAISLVIAALPADIPTPP